eukprot:3474058-Pleurochrysis_carterae.AAC.1
MPATSRHTPHTAHASTPAARSRTARTTLRRRGARGWQVKKMLSWRLSDEPVPDEEEDPQMRDPQVRASIGCTIFLGVRGLYPK